MELEKQQYLDTFLHIVRSSRTKNEFLKNVQDFDNKFTEAFQGPSFQNKASYESFQSVQQIEVPQKPKNPFINQAEEVKRNYSPSRSNNFMTQGQYNNMTNLLGNNMNKMNIPPSRSQQQFFKPPQASKTFHAGFMPKQPQKPTYQYQQTNFPPKSPSYAWPTSQQQLPPYQQYPNYLQSNFEHETKQQYQELRKMMANFNMGDKFMMNFPQGNDQGELSINSHQPSGIDAHPNEFLTAFTKDEETFGKYFKKLVPYGGKPQMVQPNPRPYMENRINPFANQ